MVSTHRLRYIFEAMEVMTVTQRRHMREVLLNGKKNIRKDSSVYLGEAICGDVNSDTNIRRKNTEGANTWSKIEGVMVDRRIFCNM